MMFTTERMRFSLRLFTIMVIDSDNSGILEPFDDEYDFFFFFWEGENVTWRFTRFSCQRNQSLNKYVITKEETGHYYKSYVNL